MPASGAGVLQRAAVGGKGRVGTEQGEGAADGLGHEQTVEGIAVVQGQLLERQQMGRPMGRSPKPDDSAQAMASPADRGMSLRARVCLMAISQSET